MNDFLTNAPLDLKLIFPFELDEFQKQAIAALDQGKSVVVCAPTGSGKTLIGEYAIYRALARKKRVFYTTPLKALSNQKFRDFQEKMGVEEVGLITGDTVYNPNGSVIVMTTEIFRNMLYETPIGQVGTSLENVATLVLDECHYISDKGRGTVWEESIIYCPPFIQLVALSATVGNPEELTHWINQVRDKANSVQNISKCELINSDFRPVPLRYYFTTKEGLFPLLDGKQNKINPRLKEKTNNGKRRRNKREDCPSILMVVEQLHNKDMLPAIYVIFSRRGCDQAMRELKAITLVNQSETRAIYYRLLLFFLSENISLQEALLQWFEPENPTLHEKLTAFLANDPQADDLLLNYLLETPDVALTLWQFLAEVSQLIKLDQLEPLTRGIAAHHAGILPLWKELVEQLFEVGLIKVVFATATLSAGINMPARTTVISALSKRTDDGHSMLTPSEFVQIAGRAGRRGMDEVGHVVTVQTPFEGSKEAAFLATAKPEPLQSCFTPSYGMVLNLLQKHTLEEAKDLLERSFAEYLARLKLTPDRQAIATLTTELAKLDVELAGIEQAQVVSYQKLKDRIREEERLFKILEQQASNTIKQKLSRHLPNLAPGQILHLKGKYIKVSDPIRAIFVQTVSGSGQAPDLLCLGEDNRWYIAPYGDVAEINSGSVSISELAHLSPSLGETKQLGGWRRGDEQTAQFSQKIEIYARKSETPPELLQQAERIAIVETQLSQHPLSQRKNIGRLLKSFYHRVTLREQLHKSQIQLQKQQSRKSYYWEEFLNLIEILREFNALDGYHPTQLGKAAATIRGENELWLGLVLMSGQLDHLEPSYLAAAMSAVITEPLRPDTWCNYVAPPEVLETFRLTEANFISLREIRRQLYQAQTRYEITIPVWLENQLLGLVAQWADGGQWQEICENTNLDEGDLVRLLRRTVDLLWQIPQIQGISAILRENARAAIIAMKRFPI
ncbi:DEAD/DEAH box helicase [Aphanothece hegewaldii CCALA 016]|uniref:DEAD/DEAH box helicase n=1 Tax=Aphanothece hegewaldii CCALA 016 TaxID=2107694 RepID=A0A2T1LRJ7_9CHRO|nr:DEAD/DEAH box helicase [Aphanothece hegewaldii]PSF31120.1 DEAD/DEAH box helicase [Aphanothece hegewaldii CCALA 016]